MKKVILVCALVVFHLIRISPAESIYIEDASFDDVVIPDGISSNLIYNPTSSEYPSQPPHGENVCRILEGQGFDESPVDLTIEHDVLPNSFYVLEVNIGTPWYFEFPMYPPRSGFGAELWAGTNLLESATVFWGGTGWHITPPVGGFQTITVPAYIPEEHSAIGSQLRIRLFAWVVSSPPQSPPVSIVDFDHMRLSRYDDGPTTSIISADSNDLQLHFSHLATNVVYKWELIDKLTSSSLVLHYDYFYADDVTNNLTTSVRGNQGFIKLEPYFP